MSPAAKSTPVRLRSTAAGARYLPLARRPEIDVAKLEQLIAADERREALALSARFSAAFAAMAAELPIIDEHGVLKRGDQVIGAYALFEDINEAIRPVLKTFGFALSFGVSQTSDYIEVTANLIHTSGHVRSTSLRLPPDPSGDRNSLQAVGSALSYAKRYTACALLNLTSRGEDDDAVRAAGCISAEQVEIIEAKLGDTGADRNRFLKYVKAESLERLPAARFEAALHALDARTQNTGAQDDR